MDQVIDRGTPLIEDPARLDPPLGDLTSAPVRSVGVDETAFLRATGTHPTLFATGIADRQISAMATHLEEKLHEAGVRRVRLEGGGSDWVLIDADDVIIHLFRPEVRTFYNLERMWAFGDEKAAATA